LETKLEQIDFGSGPFKPEWREYVFFHLRHATGKETFKFLHASFNAIAIYSLITTPLHSCEKS
jgi:hypothetical protein